MAVHTAKVEKAQVGRNTAAAVERLTGLASMEMLVLVAMAANCMNLNVYCTRRLYHAGLVALQIERPDTEPGCTVDVV